MRKPTNRFARGGFTLIEILVVLVIMGFLVAMVAPKLAGVVDGASETTDETSLTRFSAAVNEYVLDTGSIPSGLTNLISTEQIAFAIPGGADAAATLVSVSDGKKLNGPEILSKEFSERMVPMIHFLNQAEAIELAGVVGGAVLGLEGVDGTGKVTETYVRNKVSKGLPVMMIGAGFADSAPATTDAAYAMSNEVLVDATAVGSVTVNPDNNSTSMLAATGVAILTEGSDPSTNSKTYARIGEAKNLLRIVMGVSNRNQMVVQGFLDESGVASRVDTDNYTYGDYSIIIPRLAATTARFFGDTQLQATAGPNVKHVTFQAIKYDQLDNGTYQISARTPHMGPLFGGQLSGQSTPMTTVVNSTGHVIGERGGWFAAKITKGFGSNLDGGNKK